jgi:membrane associated rhomboid family serine protease
MFPLSDDNAGRTTTPFVTWTLIAVNVAVFIFQMTLGAGQMAFILTWGLQPNDLIHLRDLPAVLTSMFLHGGVMHLVGNMFYLHVFGDNLEDVMGHGKFLVFYLICGFAAGLAQVVIDPTSEIPMIGASGAIAGVLGGYIRLFPHARVRTAIFFVLIRTLPAWILLGFWFVMNAWNAFQTFGDQGGGVAFMAHVGGFVAGFLLVGFFTNERDLNRQRRVRAEHEAMLAYRRGQQPL